MHRDLGRPIGPRAPMPASACTVVLAGAKAVEQEALPAALPSTRRGHSLGISRGAQEYPDAGCVGDALLPATAPQESRILRDEVVADHSCAAKLE